MIDRLWCRRDDCEIDRLHPEHEDDFIPDREALGDPPQVRKGKGRRTPMRNSIPVETIAEVLSRHPMANARVYFAPQHAYWKTGGKLGAAGVPTTCYLGHRLLPKSTTCTAGHTRRSRQRQI